MTDRDDVRSTVKVHVTLATDREEVSVALSEAVAVPEKDGDGEGKGDGVSVGSCEPVIVGV